jgi:hypothetical protein
MQEEDSGDHARSSAAAAVKLGEGSQTDDLTVSNGRADGRPKVPEEPRKDEGA